MSLRDLHYVVARHRAEILLSGKLTGEDVSRLVLAREKGPLRDSLTEFPSSSFEEEENRSLRRVYRYLERYLEEFSRLLMTLFEEDSCQGLRDCWQYFTIERNSND